MDDKRDSGGDVRRLPLEKTDGLDSRALGMVQHGEDAPVGEPRLVVAPGPGALRLGVAPLAPSPALPPTAEPDRERRDMLVPMPDLRGFAALCEPVPPGRTSRILSDYLTAMVDSILGQSRRVQDLVCDRILAVFGAPGPDPDHAWHAVLRAFEMQDGIREFSGRRERELGKRFALRVAGHARLVLGRTVGSARQQRYAAVGDPVDSVARLEELNRDLGIPIVLSGEVVERIRNRAHVHSKGVFTVRASGQPLEVFELVGLHRLDGVPAHRGREKGAGARPAGDPVRIVDLVTFMVPRADAPPQDEAPVDPGTASGDRVSFEPQPGGPLGADPDQADRALEPPELPGREHRRDHHEEGMNQAIPITRRLAAVAFADVVGWSRLIEKNDVETLRAWKALRADLLEPKIRGHGGRLLEIAGDAVLVEFESAVAAVAWALDTQRELSGQDRDEREIRLNLRIGINVEDVIVDDDRLIGDGVNIAARIVPLASPGGIVVTSAVRDYIWNKMPVSFGDLGERELRNISRPIHVYRIDAQDPGAGIPVRSQPYLSWARRPAVAVLPFRNLGGNPEEGYFGEGITEDIISGLSRSHSLYVIAWNSTLRYRDRRVDVRDIAAELGVRYILEGSVRRQASRLRISSELLDATSSRTVWADKFDGADNDIFEFQDRIASSIVGTLEPRLYQAEAARALGKPTESLDAYECVLRALSLLYTFNDRDFAEAGKYLERAVSLDSLYAQAHAYLAWWLNLLRGEGRSSDPAGDARRAVRAATTAVEIDPDDAFCLAVAGHVQGFLNKNPDAAVDMFDRALRQNENCAFAWGISGPTYCFLGRPDEALERLRNAWRLSPFDPLNFFFCTVAGIAEFVASRYDQAIGWLRKAQRMNPRFAACHRTLTASLALSGDIEGARAAAESLLAVEPRFRVSAFASWYPLRRRDDLERLANGLRLAGLPE